MSVPEQGKRLYKLLNQCSINRNDLSTLKPIGQVDNKFIVCSMIHTNLNNSL